jgi:hypothetical protein
VWSARRAVETPEKNLSGATMKWTVMLFDRDRLPVWGAEVERNEPPMTVSLPVVAFGMCTARNFGRATESQDADTVLHFVESAA